MAEINYNKLRLDVIERLIDERHILCKDNRTDMIRHLKLYDEGKYIKETTYEEMDDEFIVGIDIKNTNHLIDMSGLVQRKDAKSLGRFSMGMVFFLSKRKLI